MTNYLKNCLTGSITLLLILFSLNGYAAEPCLTPECAAFQSVSEANRKVREAEQEARELKRLSDKANQKSDEAYRRAIKFDDMREYSRAIAISLDAIKANQKAAKAWRKLIKAEWAAKEAMRRARELSQRQGSN